MNHIGEKELGLEELVDTLFNNPPKDPKSFSISFVNKDSITDLKEVFENLLILFTEGMKILYGNNGKVNLDTLTENDINNYNKYMNSIGLKLLVDIRVLEEGINQDYSKFKYSNINITSRTKLNELKLPFLTQRRVYIISFDFI
tara:strand:- start:9970 stop:10401 length:432 start_codon:yes stop_codon:yes gene_type:complete